MSLKHGLLGLLDYGSMTGYDLCKAFDDSLAFFWQATRSQVYRELTAMEKNKWLESDLVIQTGKPNRKVYKLTKEGREELDRWLATPAGMEDLENRSAFLMRLFFSSRLNPRQTMENLGRATLQGAREPWKGDEIEEYSKGYRTRRPVLEADRTRKGVLRHVRPLGRKNRYESAIAEPSERKYS